MHKQTATHAHDHAHAHNNTIHIRNCLPPRVCTPACPSSFFVATACLVLSRLGRLLTHRVEPVVDPLGLVLPLRHNVTTVAERRRHLLLLSAKTRRQIQVVLPPLRRPHHPSAARRSARTVAPCSACCASPGRLSCLEQLLLFERHGAHARAIGAVRGYEFVGRVHDHHCP